MNPIYLDVLARTSVHCGVTLEEALASTRKANAVMARQVAWFILHTRYHWSHQTIATNTKTYHRLTIRHGINRIGEWPSNSRVSEIVDKVTAETAP
jgi:chromosomal replication initiation ATPase DnaA